MKRQDKRKPARQDNSNDDDVEPRGKNEWRRLFATFREAFDWALDIAVALARDFPEEVEAVERVRSFMRAQLTGARARVAVEDVLLTFALLISAIDRDLGLADRPDPWFTTNLAMQFPPAFEDLPRVPRILIARPSWSRGVPRHLVA